MSLTQLTLWHGGAEVIVQFAANSSDASVKELVTDAVNAPRGTPFRLYRREPRVLVAVNAQLPAGTYDVEALPTPDVGSAGGGGGGGGSAELRTVLRLLEDMRRERDGDDTSSVTTPADYEEAGRQCLLGMFEGTFGLRVVTPDVHRPQGDGGLLEEWDFRAPVNCSGPALNPPKSDSLIIFPDRAHYVRPEPPERARKLTPKKGVSAAGIPVEIASDFMAVFEITTDEKWAKALVLRLEQRLVVTLSRARQFLGDEVGILDIVAIVGVLGVYSCQRSIPQRVTAGSTPLLHAIMEAGRFVFVYIPFTGSPTGKPKSVHVGSPLAGVQAATGAAGGKA